jgi:hypothetical protein
LRSWVDDDSAAGNRQAVGSDVTVDEGVGVQGDAASGRGEVAVNRGAGVQCQTTMGNLERKPAGMVGGAGDSSGCDPQRNAYDTSSLLSSGALLSARRRP